MKQQSPVLHRIAGRARTMSRAFSLIEALVAVVVVAMVASAAAVAVSIGIDTQQENRLAVLAMHAAELQMSSCMEADYDAVDALAGHENAGAMLAPARPGSTARPLLPSSFAELSRTTTVTAETRTFAQYGGVQMLGKRIQIDIVGPNNTPLASLTRFRGKEDEL